MEIGDTGRLGPQKQLLTEKMALARHACLQSMQDLSRYVRAQLEGQPENLDLGKLSELAHRLRGTAGTFGFTGVASAAADLDRSIASGKSIAHTCTVARELLLQLEATK